MTTEKKLELKKGQRAVVWKHPMEPREGLHLVEMPKGAQLLSVELQPQGPSAWFLVDPTEPEVEHRALLLVGTGVEFPPEVGEGRVEFLRTLVLGPGAVTHAFEVRA